ncbi:MAG: hypothetical protein CMN30_22010 [Sandaracinus sp.]|nr:hypothetical protein [Sandaracinus sp.]MAR56492.1 hypothetical protein [Rickettsiales bacterium]
MRIVRTDAKGHEQVTRERYRAAPRVVRVGTAPRAPVAESLLGELASLGAAWLLDLIPRWCRSNRRRPPSHRVPDQRFA